MKKKICFLVGSQQLYGDAVLNQIDSNVKEMMEFFNNITNSPVEFCFNKVLTDANEIMDAILEVNASNEITGVICWMHTFSPGKMWIRALEQLSKPMLHFHTQVVDKIPFESIDMNYMNLHQSAHGDREFGFISTRLNMMRKVVTGFYKDPQTIEEILTWSRASIGYHYSKNLKIIRFGESMTDVAVTDGDKLEALIKLGWNVETQGVGELVKYVSDVTEQEVDSLFDIYNQRYDVITNKISNIKEQARLEIALKRYLDENKFNAFTTSFENLHGLKQLPGLAAQSLMTQGYGFGAEGDWKAAGLLSIIKKMSDGLAGGSSFMEEYTYNLENDDSFILGSHMLEICPSLSKGKAKIDVAPLFVGGKEEPARLIFNNKEQEGLIVTLIDLGNRFRMIVNKVDLIERNHMPNLPVAQVLWRPRPNLKVASTSWILAGGGHHSVLTTSLKEEHLRDFSEMANLEYILIDDNTTINNLKNELAIKNLLSMYKK